MSKHTPTTEDDDEGVFAVLRTFIATSYPPGTIGYDYLTNAIDHIRKMRREIKASKRR